MEGVVVVGTIRYGAFVFLSDITSALWRLRLRLRLRGAKPVSEGVGTKDRNVLICFSCGHSSLLVLASGTN